MNKIRIIAVEDDADYQILIKETLKAYQDFELVAQCTTSQEAIDQAAALQPDLVLMDLNLESSVMDGAEAARRIRLMTDAKIVILTAFDSPDIITNACKRAFASGYVLKRQANLLVPTLQATATGPTPQSTLICSLLLESLTVAERTVFERMMGKDILLHSKQKTILNQQANILRKLDLTSRDELLHIFAAYVSK